jgi:aflatoxin B1 aldehyde reductase
MPVLLFGAATIGGRTFNTAEDTSALLDALKACKINHLDTAAVYPLMNPGASERLIGVAKAGEKGFVIDTKIKIRKEGPKHESLKKEAIDDSVANSLEILGVSQVDVLYCHTPDTVTPLEETAAALHDHVSKGHCKKVGPAETPKRWLLSGHYARTSCY